MALREEEIMKVNELRRKWRRLNSII